MYLLTDSFNLNWHFILNYLQTCRKLFLLPLDRVIMIHVLKQLPLLHLSLQLLPIRQLLHPSPLLHQPVLLDEAHGKHFSCLPLFRDLLHLLLSRLDHSLQVYLLDGFELVLTRLELLVFKILDSLLHRSVVFVSEKLDYLVFQRLCLGKSQDFRVLEVLLNVIRSVLNFLFVHLNGPLASIVVLDLILDCLHLFEFPEFLIDRFRYLLRLHHSLILHPRLVLLSLHLLLLLLLALLVTIKALLDFLTVSLSGLKPVSVLSGLQLLTLVVVLLRNRLLEFRE
jgi:hypothetical protein